MKDIINSLKTLIDKQVLTSNIKTFLLFVNNPKINYNPKVPENSFRISYQTGVDTQPKLYNPPKFKIIPQVKGNFEITVKDEKQTSAIFKALLLYIFTEENNNYRFISNSPTDFDNELTFVYWCAQKLLINPALDSDFLYSKKGNLGSNLYEFDSVQTSQPEPEPVSQAQPQPQPEPQPINEEINTQDQELKDVEDNVEKHRTWISRARAGFAKGKKEKENQVETSLEQKQKENDVSQNNNDIYKQDDEIKDLVNIAKDLGVNEGSIAKIEQLSPTSPIANAEYEPLEIDVSSFFKIEDWRF